MRGKLDVETLLKVILVLVALWLGLQILGEILGLFAFILGPLSHIVGLVVLLLLVLHLLDQI